MACVVLNHVFVRLCVISLLTKHTAFHYVLVPWGFVAVTIVRFETGPYSCMHRGRYSQRVVSNYGYVHPWALQLWSITIGHRERLLIVNRSLCILYASFTRQPQRLRIGLRRTVHEGYLTLKVTEIHRLIKVWIEQFKAYRLCITEYNSCQLILC